MGKRQAEIKATATAQALPTATRIPKPVPTYIAPKETIGSGGGGFPWDRILEVGILGGLSAAVYFGRNQIRGFMGRIRGGFGGGAGGGPAAGPGVGGP